jgi:hypothetical protein
VSDLGTPGPGLLQEIEGTGEGGRRDGRRATEMKWKGVELDLTKSEESNAQCSMLNAQCEC